MSTSTRTGILPAVLGAPASAANLPQDDWDTLMSEARRVRMLARLAGIVQRAPGPIEYPAAFTESAKGAAIYADFLRRRASMEIHELDEMLGDTPYPVVLLKGAAYIAQENTAAPGRGLSDIDILVPREALGDLEEKLAAGGWTIKDELSDYDNYYYREYSHELPPQWHTDFQFELDVHHNILQPTHRVAIDAARLLDAILPIKGTRFFALSLHDQILHSATHLIMSDELRGGLRDVHDIKLLYEEGCASDPEFPAALIDRAASLGLARALYYCIDFARAHMDLKVPEDCWQQLQKAAPNSAVNALMAGLIQRRFMPSGAAFIQDDWAEQLLYIRSHWIRMPPGLLLRHLARKMMQRKGANTV